MQTEHGYTTLELAACKLTITHETRYWHFPAEVRDAAIRRVLATDPVLAAEAIPGAGNFPGLLAAYENPANYINTLQMHARNYRAICETDAEAAEVIASEAMPQPDYQMLINRPNEFLAAAIDAVGKYIEKIIASDVDNVIDQFISDKNANYLESLLCV